MLSDNGAAGPVEFLARLGDSERAALLALAQRRTLRKGEVLFRAGDAVDGVHLVETGRVKVYRLSPGGKEVLLWFCSAGEIFGIAEACHGGARQVYVEACEPTRLLCVAPAEFRAFLATWPGAALAVAEVLAQRVRSLGNVIQGLVASDVSERLLQLLARLAASHGLPDGERVRLNLRITHQEIANMIGATRQSVTSALGELGRAGVVSVEKRRIYLSRDAVQRFGAPAAPEGSRA
jgi:CRP/FNR family transcriptional regulator